MSWAMCSLFLVAAAFSFLRLASSAARSSCSGVLAGFFGAAFFLGFFAAAAFLGFFAAAVVLLAARVLVALPRVLLAPMEPFFGFAGVA